MLSRILKIVGMILFACSLLSARESDSERAAFFERKIRPVLVEHCYSCHSEQAADDGELKGGLKLDSRESLTAGGDSGPAVIPNDAAKSLLLSAMRYEDFEMPPKQQLPDEIVADFEHWIESGAYAPPQLKRDQPTTSFADFIQASKDAWAYQTPKMQTLPDVRDTTWPRARLDYFVLSKLEGVDLQPSKEAERRTWFRRVHYDLTGLPPTHAAMEEFLADRSTEAFSLAVDRLIALPQFGEQWARMWLDVARYAEDQAHIVGNNESLFYPNAYRFREWVIKSLNDDMPYDRFIELQLAADLITPELIEDDVALGFIGLGPKYYDRKRLQVKADEWEDRIDTVTRGLLGLTVACARCHDHKFDPISTKDYYGLAGVFASTRMYNRPIKDSKTESKDGKKAPKNTVHIVREGEPTDLNVFIRGNVERKGELVKRRYLELLSREGPNEFEKGSGRQELAARIANAENPLTARVYVNRVFGKLMGRSIVGTPSNFGKLGQQPTHPELLDDLAIRFTQNEWSLKWLVRDVVLSSTYRQSSQPDEKLLAADPANRLFGRMNRRRLTIENWRDTVLSLAGQLDTRIGGRSIDIADRKQSRRTVYAKISRFQLHSMLSLFDFPDANVHAATRVETTTPLQKLFVLNHPFVVGFAADVSTKLNSIDSKIEERIERAYQAIFTRMPNPEELRLGVQYHRDSAGNSDTAWKNYVHALLASNELMFID